jgi:hypothetical protein
LWLNSPDHDAFFSFPPTSRHYRLLQVIHQVVSFSMSQLLPAIVAILILLYQLHYGLMQKSDLRANELAILWPYIELLIAYMGYEIVRAPLVLDREHNYVIQDIEVRLATVRNELSLARAAIATDPRSYSERHLATLERLGRDGQQLYGETFRYSPNHPAEAQNRLDDWFKRYRDWRVEVLSVLNDRDAANFERPATAGSETKARPGAYNQLHLVARGKLLEETECIAGVLKRYSQ